MGEIYVIFLPKNLAKVGSSRKSKDILYKTYTLMEMIFTCSLREIDTYL